MDICIEIQLKILEYVPYRYIKSCRATCHLWDYLINTHIRKQDLLKINVTSQNLQLCCEGCNLCINQLDHFLLYDSFEIVTTEQKLINYVTFTVDINEEFFDYIKHAKFVKFHNINLNKSLHKLMYIPHIVIYNDYNTNQTSSCDYIHNLTYVKTLDITEASESSGIVSIPSSVVNLRFLSLNSIYVTKMSLKLCTKLKELTCISHSLTDTHKQKLELNKLTVFITKDYKFQLDSILKQFRETKIIKILASYNYYGFEIINYIRLLSQINVEDNFRYCVDIYENNLINLLPEENNACQIICFEKFNPYKNNFNDILDSKNLMYIYDESESKEYFIKKYIPLTDIDNI